MPHAVPSRPHHAPRRRNRRPATAATPKALRWRDVTGIHFGDSMRFSRSGGKRVIRGGQKVSGVGQKRKAGEILSLTAAAICGCRMHSGMTAANTPVQPPTKGFS
jgi:hypothetical protein